VIERVTQIIFDRVNLIDDEEYEKTLELIEEKLGLLEKRIATGLRFFWSAPQTFL
jgi:hypothetical protein